MREAKIRSSSQALVSDMARERVLVLLGDSNFHYCPKESCLSTLFWSPGKSMGNMVRTKLPGRVILAYEHKIGETDWSNVQSSLDTLKSLCPDTEVHVLFLCGQNDAHSLRNKRTRNFEDVRAKFRQLVERQMKKLEELIPYATIYWVIPFDDPKTKVDPSFGPQYEALVKEIADAISLKERAITFGPFSSFQPDMVHLATTDRTNFANQVLDWFANL